MWPLGGVGLRPVLDVLMFLMFLMFLMLLLLWWWLSMSVSLSLWLWLRLLLLLMMIMMMMIWVSSIGYPWIPMGGYHGAFHTICPSRGNPSQHHWVKQLFFLFTSLLCPWGFGDVCEHAKNSWFINVYSGKFRHINGWCLKMDDDDDTCTCHEPKNPYLRKQRQSSLPLCAF